MECGLKCGVYVSLTPVGWSDPSSHWFSLSCVTRELRFKEWTQFMYLVWYRSGVCETVTCLQNQTKAGKRQSARVIWGRHWSEVKGPKDYGRFFNFLVADVIKVKLKSRQLQALLHSQRENNDKMVWGKAQNRITRHQQKQYPGQDNPGQHGIKSLTIIKVPPRKGWQQHLFWTHFPAG